MLGMLQLLCPLKLLVTTGCRILARWTTPAFLQYHGTTLATALHRKDFIFYVAPTPCPRAALHRVYNLRYQTTPVAAFTLLPQVYPICRICLISLLPLETTCPFCRRSSMRRTVGRQQTQEMLKHHIPLRLMIIID
jgi:hypothetical protein